MVKGKRLRSAVAVPKNGICYANNKKKNDKLNGKIQDVSKTSTMHKFFKPIIDEDLFQEVKPMRRRKHFDTIHSNLQELCVKEKEIGLEDFDLEESVPITPILNRTRNMTNLMEKSPPTPHRIELRSEVIEEIPAESEPLQKELKEIIVKPRVPPKAKRKLNNNILQNTNSKSENNHKLTEYFPVRRSVRKTQTIVLEEKQRSLEKALRNNIEEGLKVCIFESKGRGVIASKFFGRGEYVVEYSGDLIDIQEAKKREEIYAQDQNTGCYMYYFRHNGQQYCVDATAESPRLGRLVNHSRNGNLMTRTLMVDGKPRLVLIAKDDIQAGEELTYDYGDRSKESLKHHPWLAY